MPITFTPIRNETFVASVDGVDLRKPLDAETLATVIEGSDRYAVLVFHDQPLNNEELVALGAQLGPLDVGLQEKLMKKVQDRYTSAAISDISNVDAASGDVADQAHKQAIMNVGNRFWHSDSSYDRHPYRYSILTATTAASKGGATEYADLRSAYDTLDDDTKALIADRTATFYSHFTRQWLGIEDRPEDLRVFPPVRWPLVRTHPGSGRKLLWCDSKVCEISGMSIPEGRALAHELIEHIGQREHVYSHYWKPNDVVLYDNRSVLHRGRRFDMRERREMRRVATVDDSTALSQARLDVVAPFARDAA
ncbi:TauD/TfdA family dioxygenase [Sphingobium sp. Sx8-8]|uniref:TauD/TfdA dioxygenase family protein n=1 Tax=Sphingobium sp. Sx8-8 TaxID=2933617 RepID=UPI001F55D7C9|nr:TauD/TfdA family dioxygenase [Sphingobium sp. Sx8-8]